MNTITASPKYALRFLTFATASLITSVVAAATTQLADQPIEATISAPANVVLTPSVEYPTANSVAHIDTVFSETTRYDGYFDPLKCYEYVSDPDTSSKKYFAPVGAVTSGTFKCSGYWSGNFMNWATMQAIDLFRWAMTGGARDVDLPASFSGGNGRTVLKRAYQSGQGGTGNFPNRSVSSSVIYDYVGAPWNRSLGATIINSGKGEKVDFVSGGTTVSLDVRVRVCVEGMLETNCKAYRDSAGSAVIYRPEGLIQENSNSMRFAAFGYLLDSDLKRDGAALRAPMADVSTELTETGAYQSTNSGVMSYLNLFGFQSGAYKTYDPVGEMYAEALRYLQGASGPTSGYADNLSGTMADFFPVETAWKDPFKYSCQKSFIIGIGDVNTHADRNFPGNSTSRSKEPNTIPSNAWTPANGNAFTWTDAVGSKEKMTNLGGKTLGNVFPYNGDAVSPDTQGRCCNENGALIAGMAYYAHTQDIRPDIVGSKQTVSTFWIDVLEYQRFRRLNQYWLAAKYGGFVDKNDNGTYDDGEVWNAKGRKYIYNGVTFDLPDNYFPAAQASDMVSGLKEAFSQINSLIASGAGVGLSSSSISTSLGDSSVFGVSYDSKTWAGSAKGFRITAIDATTGQLTLSEKWDAADRIDLQDWNTGRKIATSKWVTDTSGNSLWTAIPFRWAQITADQKTQLGPQSVLQFLRGRRDLESTDTEVRSYRQRKHVLGDVVNSEAVFVGMPSSGYSDAFNPGYSSFVSSNGSRKSVVYVGANDGMLHALDGDTSGSSTSTGGSELWAYIPSFLFEGPDGTPADSGLAALAKQSFVHHYYVDQTPVVRDVDFKRAARTGQSIETDPSVYDWRTILVGGLGKGGRGFYAIDITDPSSASSESAVAANVLWEFFDVDMGYSYGRPLIVKTKRWGWVVVLTGGYNNVNGPVPAKRGKGVLYVLNPETGELLQKIFTDFGTATSPAGLAQITGYTQNYQDYTAEYIYGGDLLGNVWRFDLTSSTDKIPAPLLLATLKDSSDVAQPITTAPQVEYSASDAQLRRWVFVGTGQQLHSLDSPNYQVQSFYALLDGSKSTAYSSSNLPTGVNFPVTKSVMKQATYADLATGGVTVGGTTPMGWYVNLTGQDSAVTNGATERVTINPMANDGVISWVGSIPSTDPCTPGGSSRLYALKYGTAKSVVYTTNTAGVRTYVSYLDPKSPLVKAQPVRQGNSIRFLGTKVDGTPVLIGPGLGAASTPRVVNWRFVE